MLGVVHTTDSVSDKTKPNVIHHTITVLIKFFLFLELISLVTSILKKLIFPFFLFCCCCCCSFFLFYFFIRQ